MEQNNPTTPITVNIISINNTPSVNTPKTFTPKSTKENPRISINSVDTSLTAETTNLLSVLNIKERRSSKDVFDEKLLNLNYDWQSMISVSKSDISRSISPAPQYRSFNPDLSPSITNRSINRSDAGTPSQLSKVSTAFNFIPNRQDKVERSEKETAELLSSFNFSSEISPLNKKGTQSKTNKVFSPSKYFSTLNNLFPPSDSYGSPSPSKSSNVISSSNAADLVVAPEIIYNYKEHARSRHGSLSDILTGTLTIDGGVSPKIAKSSLVTHDSNSKIDPIFLVRRSPSISSIENLPKVRRSFSLAPGPASGMKSARGSFSLAGMKPCTAVANSYNGNYKVIANGLYAIGPKIGEGSFGVVNLGWNISTEKEVAIKIVFLNRYDFLILGKIRYWKCKCIIT